jgi:hypothetical protein
MKYFVTCYQTYIVLSIPTQAVMKVKTPPQLASPLRKQQMLATRAAGVVIAHHPSSLARATTPIQTQTSLFYIRFRFLLLFYAYCET